jgi:hypothetical protein
MIHEGRAMAVTRGCTDCTNGTERQLAMVKMQPLKNHVNLGMV